MVHTSYCTGMRPKQKETRKHGLGEKGGGGTGRPHCGHSGENLCTLGQSGSSVGSHAAIESTPVFTFGWSKPPTCPIARLAHGCQCQESICGERR